MLLSPHQHLGKALLAYAEPLRAARRVWVAYSGGADSTALLLNLTRLLPELDTRASHINHGVQSEAQNWVAHCEALCARLGVPLDVGVLSPPVDQQFAQGFEAWARAGRYAYWQRLLGEGDLLLLAHHGTDQQETVALKLLQGRLPLPMPASRSIGGPVDENGPRLLRPWLAQPGARTRAMLVAAGEPWIEDPSNRSNLMLRNRLRNGLLPVLVEEDSGWSAALKRCGALTERLVREFSGGMVTAAQFGEVLRLPLAALECPDAVLGALLAISPETSRGLTRGQIAAALDQLKHQSVAPRGGADRQGVQLSANLQAAEWAGLQSQPQPLSLWLADDLPEPELLVWREPKVDACSLQLSPELSGWGECAIELEHGWLRLAGAAGRVLRLRTPEPGDRVLLGGKQRPLREVLRDGGVPRWARASYPVLCSVPLAAAGASGAETTELVAVPRYIRANVPPPATGRVAPRGGDLEASIGLPGELRAEFWSKGLDQFLLRVAPKPPRCCNKLAVFFVVGSTQGGIRSLHDALYICDRWCSFFPG